MEQIQFLNRRLLAELPQYQEEAAQCPADEAAQRRLLRALMNVRPAHAPGAGPPGGAGRPALRRAGGVGRGGRGRLPAVPADPRLALWRGNITRLRADAIVKAATAAVGLLRPLPRCIDNAIHSAAGLQLREECRRIMAEQGRPEPNGRARLTEGYNLPARYVLHTVGPIVGDG